jgi:hypothetical protein
VTAVAPDCGYERQGLALTQGQPNHPPPSSSSLAPELALRAAAIKMHEARRALEAQQGRTRRKEAHKAQTKGLAKDTGTEPSSSFFTKRRM